MMLHPLLTLALIGQAASQPATGLKADGTARDISAAFSLLVEVGETSFNVQESWSLHTNGKVIAADQLAIILPAGAKLARMAMEDQGFKARENGTAIEATGPLAADKDINFAYVLDRGGESLDITKIVPFSAEGGRVIVQNSPNLSVTINVPNQRRTKELNGIDFVIYDLGPTAAGAELKVSISGFPSRTVWPKRAATAAALAILAWMIFAIRTRAVPGANEGGLHIDGPLSPHARRDQIVKALEVLNRDFKAEKVKPKRYERRHGELMKELADVLHELELDVNQRA